MTANDNKWTGKRTIRPDGADKVTGRAAYAADTNMPGMIWGKVLRSPIHTPHQVDQHQEGRGPSGREGGGDGQDIVEFPLDKS